MMPSMGVRTFHTNKKKDGANRFDEKMESNDDFWYETGGY